MKRKEAYHADMRNFVEWLRIIGDDKGAHEDYFRDEGIVWALPPEAKIMKGRFVKNIRLYCHLVSSSVVILYNGGIKSEATVQQCPNVSMHWQNAKIATRKLKDQIEHEGKRITNIEDIIIQL